MGKEVVIQTVARVLIAWSGSLVRVGAAYNQWTLSYKRASEAQLKLLVKQVQEVTAVLWEYEVGTGKNATWVEHDQYVSAELEKADKAGIAKVTIEEPNAAKKEKNLIIVYLDKMRQIDVKTGENHRIRRGS